MGASGTSLTLLRALLESRHLTLADATLFLSDLGPGSFTGVKVGVTLAKTLAFAQTKPAGGAQSFELIDPDGLVVLPSKKGEWFVREPGQEPVRQPDLPAKDFKGYGTGIDDPTYPRAERFATLLSRIIPIEPERLVPEYLIEPSISKPKVPYKDVPSGPPSPLAKQGESDGVA